MLSQPRAEAGQSNDYSVVLRLIGSQFLDDIYLYTEFLMNFSDQGRYGIFAQFNLAPRKLPPTSSIAIRVSATSQHLVAIEDHRGDH